MTDELISKERFEYCWLLHYYREFCEFEVITPLGGKSFDCKKGVYF